MRKLDLSDTVSANTGGLKVNTDKWKSVVIAIGDYQRLRELARDEHRTLSGQFTHLLEEALRERSRAESRTNSG